MKQEKWFTIHFEDEGTGENSDDSVFASVDELISSRNWDYPGYGCQTIKEISRKCALEMLISEIDECVQDWLSDDAIDVNLDDDEVIEPKWFRCAIDHIKWGNPGWQLLYEEYFANDKDLKDQLVKACEEEIQVCKTLFESGKRKYMPDGYYTAKEVLQKIK